MSKSDDGMTPAEIAAFDQGVMDGEQLRHNPYDLNIDPRLWEAWETGASLGRINRNAKK